MLYYNIVDGNAQVTRQNTGYYPTGALTIPSSVTNGSTTYVVTSIGNNAFYQCSNLTSVTIPDGVTSIGDGAFSYCRGLTSITIPDGVTFIGVSAFYGCSSLTSITIPDSVTLIGNNTFYDCSGLTSVNLPDGVTSIGSYAFYGCSGLTSVSIPDGVTSIGSYAFRLCRDLTSVTIGSGVASIGNDAFLQCSGLTSILVANGNTVYDCRENCNAIIESSSNTLIVGCMNTIIPASVTSIGEDAFYGCTNLTSITIPNGVTAIGRSAFAECNGLISVIIPNSVTSIGNYAFSYIRHIEYHGNATGSPWDAYSMNGVIDGDFVFSDDAKHYLLAYLGAGGDVTIPSTVDTIGNRVFYGCSNLTSITIPNSVISIGSSAFYNCSSLTSVAIPNSVTSIGSHAFQNCSGLISVTIPDGVTSIGSYAFKNVRHIEYYGNATGSPWDALSMNGITDGDFVFSDNTKHYLLAYIGAGGNVVIPSSVDTIGSNAFKEYIGISSVTIPNGITSIGNSAFEDCSGLTSVTIGNSVTSIGSCAFQNCSSLTSVYFNAVNCSFGSNNNHVFSGCTNLSTLIIGENATIIPDYAFYNCRSLSSVTMGNSVTTIGNGAFSGCSGLTSVIIGNGVTSIGDYTFSGCSGLTAISIPNSVTSIGNQAFYRCSGLTSVTIPSGVTSIDFYTFLGCSGLTSVTIGNSVTSIGTQAFYGCSGLTSVTIPSSVTSIDSYAFSGCSGLTSMWMKPMMPPSLSNYSSICDSVIDVIVPRESYELYLNAGTNYTRHHIYSDTALLSIAVNDEARGYVAGCSNDTVLSYPYPDSIEIVAIPYYGYHFKIWDDDTTDSIRHITNISHDITLTAFFDPNQYTILLSSTNGTVSGAGNYNYLSNCTISANPNYGYRFTAWNDGDTNNPRTIMLTQDTQFVALFAKNQYTVTGLTDDSVMGVVSGSATVDYLDSVTLTATSNYGYRFLRWSDYHTENPRTVTVTGDINMTAIFDFNQYSLSLSTDTSIHGSVSGAGLYNYLSECTINATANYGYHFTHWSDGNTNNPRTLTLTQDTHLAAYYDKNIYTLTFQSDNTDFGIVNTTSVSGEYLDSTILIYTTPIPHYHFTQWNDGNTKNPRKFIFDDNRTYTASFAIDVHTVSVQVDNLAHGTVSGAGSREYGQPITVSATPYSGYRFTHWSNGATYNPYTFAVLEDKALTANFVVDGEPWQDTVVMYDTAYVVLHDTTYIDVHDTTYIDVFMHDTTIVTDTVTLTEYVPVHDTTYIDVHDTIYIDVHDTTYIDVFVYDTTVVTDTVTLSEYVPVHDTTYIDIHDTTYIDVYDTTYINVFVHDTTVVTDTVTLTLYDTITNTVFDTVDNYIYDTLLLTDTIWLHDTIVIHDTIYITQEDIDGTEALNAKIYQRDGQVIVEGAGGNAVTLYDANGRVLATKQDYYMPLSFDVLATGTYMIKVGSAPARRVVVIR